ncbi:MAG TPA: hypothetical protein VFC17_12165 [Candidatus Limnocylindrales bacterium]|nr:hypothetical protein [Candidatus Limnocylindrales bacterium]
MPEESQPLFEILTPLGFTVRTSSAYWRKIILKHPDLADKLESVKQALFAPDEIRRSAGMPKFCYSILQANTAGLWPWPGGRIAKVF